MKDKQGRRILPNLLNPPMPSRPPPEIPPPDPILEELIADTEDYLEAMRAYNEELEAIKESLPLGAVVHREPKSLKFSKVPDPVWKRKLRP